MDTVIRRNLVIDSCRGIALGLSSPNTCSRGRVNVVYDHQNGLVKNNVILTNLPSRERTPASQHTAVTSGNAPNAKVDWFRNLLYGSGYHADKRS